MRRLILFFSLLSLLQFTLRGSVPFYPITRNYVMSDYGSGIQNWSAAQDNKGIVYFANNNGLLEYDGFRWKLHELPVRSLIRSVFASSDGRIYVGSYEEFGYYERVSVDSLHYHSLTDRLKGYSFKNDEIWNIVSRDGEIVFQSFGRLFFYDGKDVFSQDKTTLPLNLFLVNGKCYSQLIDNGFAVVNDRTFKEIIPREALDNSDVVSALSLGKGLLLITNNGGSFIYENGKIARWDNDCETELKKSTVNRAVMTKDSSFVIGTISGGVFAVSKKGKLLWRISTENHLQNNTVLGLLCDSDNNIWAALDDGIAYVHNNSMVYYYEPINNKIGMVYDVLVNGDIAYVATNQGLYYAKNGMIRLIKGLEGQTWFVNRIGNAILCGHNNGTFTIRNTSATRVSDIKGGMCQSEISIKGKSYMLEGTYGPLLLYEKNEYGDIGKPKKLKNFFQMSQTIETDSQGNIWVEHLRKGLFRLRIDSGMDSVVRARSYSHLDDSSNPNISLFKINGRIVFSDGEGFFTYEDMKDSIIAYGAMNEQLAELRDVHNVEPAGGDDYWFVGNKKAWLVNCQMNVFRIVCRVEYRIFDNLSMEDRSTIVYDGNSGLSYLCLNNSIACINTDSTRLYHSPTKTDMWISCVRISDSNGNSKSLPVSSGSRIPSKWNTISFSLSYPAYGNYNYRISYRLKGLSDNWIDGNRRMNKNYVRLPYGSYVFEARIVDENDTLDSVEYRFEIAKPWYLSTVAIAFYVLSLLFLFAAIQYFSFKTAQKKKDIALENQRIAHQAETERQEKRIIALENEQLEASLRFKGKELSSEVMQNIAHQELLTALKEEIRQQKLSGTFTRKNLDKLLSMVDNNIVSDEKMWDVYKENFDRIHDNFFRNLKQKYPDLTAGDLRFCALLRLNLPTKEIARFMNISVRGVDGARYRLRKKFDIPQDDSLADFLIGFK